MNFLVNINLNGNELQNVVIQPLAVAPESGREGQIYYDSKDKALKYYDGSGWKSVGSGGPGGTVSWTDVQGRPSKLSEFTNDLSFINKAVEDLENYYAKSETYSKGEVYAKSETYSKQEVTDLLDTFSALSIEVVEQLPEREIKEKTIYFVKRAGSDDHPTYDEKIYLNQQWEEIGSTEIDLKEYVKKSELSAVATSGLYSDLTGTPKALAVKEATISAGNTSASVTISEGEKVLSVAASDTSSGEMVMVDARVDSTTVNLTIAQNYENDIAVLVTVI